MTARSCRIIYSSRTHSQLTQVVRELKATGYRPRITILGSREQLCVNPQVSKERGTAQNHLCRSLVAAQACSYFKNVKDFLNKNPMLPSEQLDVEDLVSVGNDYNVCPYFLSRETQGTAEVMFVPYNYLIDPTIRGTLAPELLQNAAIIFDEAHNLESVCHDAASFDLSSGDIASCIDEVSRVIRMLMAPGFVNKSEVDAEDLAKLKVILLNLEGVLDKQVLSATSSSSYSSSSSSSSFASGELQSTRAGTFIYDLFAEVSITPANVHLVKPLLQQTVDLLLDDPTNAAARKKCGLSALINMLNGVFKVCGFSRD